jgi:hypothetical protein
MEISEVPVQWHNVEGSTVRPLNDSVAMTADIFKMRRRTNWPVLPGLVVSPGSRASRAGDGMEWSELFSSVEANLPIMMLPDDRALVLFPLCKMQRIHQMAARLQARSPGIIAREKMVSFSELLRLSPLNWFTSSAYAGNLMHEVNAGTEWHFLEPSYGLESVPTVQMPSVGQRAILRSSFAAGS